jgi:DNA-binding beta-propeller fold protein YncE
MAPETANTRVRSVWLGKYDTADERGWYPITPQSRFNQLFIFTRKTTTGDATKDSDDFISSWIISDLTGGGQVEDYNEGAETGRFWYAFADTRSPGIITLPPLVSSARPNSNCTSCYPLEDGNDGIAYDAFNESGTWEVWGFNESTDAYDYNGGAGVALGSAPTGKSVRFDGVIYVPRGTTSGGGYSRITGSAGTPTVTQVSGSADPTTASPTSAPRAVAFCVYDNKLWALTAEGGIASHTIAQKDAGANAWTWPYGTTTTDFPQIDSSATPYALIVFPDKNGVESIYAKTSRGVYVYDDTLPRWIATDIHFPPHPDVNQAAAVWRPGERLHLGVGLDNFAYTAANVIVPFSGLARDHGLPQEYRGAIKDLEASLDSLYAIVGGNSTSSTSWTYDSAFGTPGTGNSEFSDIRQIAIDSSGNIYAADYGNDRVQKFTSGGVHSSNIVTSVDEVQGLCVDSSGNLYLTFRNAASDYRVRKYDSFGTLQWTSATLSTVGLGHLAVGDDDDFTYVTKPGSHTIGRILNATGVEVGTFGSSGTGDLQFNTPYGIAYAPATRSLYVVDQGNDRVQEISELTYAFVRKWGSSGSGDGQFSQPWAIACNPVNGNVYVTDIGRDDVQEFTSTGSFVRKFGSAGSGNGQFGSSQGIALNAAASGLWASDADNEDVQKFTLATATDSVSAYPTLHAWTGIGWHGLWKGSSNTVIPTHLKASNATGGYSLRWGMGDGYCYRMPLRRSLHNPRQGFLAGVDTFAASGELVTGWFDAAMAGFYKIASHLVVTMDNATSTEKVTVEFAVDGGGWESLGSVTTSGETVLEFDVVSGFSRGRKFKRMRLKFTLARGSTTTLTPVVESVVLAYQKVPKDTTAHTLEIPLHRKHKDRTPAEMYRDLVSLVEAGEMLKLIVGRDETASDGTVTSAVKRVLPASISGLQDGNGRMTRHVTLGLIEVKTGATSAA